MIFGNTLMNNAIFVPEKERVLERMFFKELRRGEDLGFMKKISEI